MATTTCLALPRERSSWRRRPGEASAAWSLRHVGAAVAAAVVSAAAAVVVTEPAAAAVAAAVAPRVALQMAYCRHWSGELVSGKKVRHAWYALVTWSAESGLDQPF